ncbi:MAG: YezD family protein [Methylacidiphilales bacterium]|nr:YezD family protein [Candidatus Methylacidiphilales bacterium]
MSSLKFGTVHVTVHDSRVIQIERLERLRLDRS